MPAKKRPGLTGVYVEIPDEMHAALEELVKRLPLGSKADHIRLAIARHLDAPPKVEQPALEELTLPAKEEGPRRGRPPKSG